MKPLPKMLLIAAAVGGLVFAAKIGLSKLPKEDPKPVVQAEAVTVESVATPTTPAPKASVPAPAPQEPAPTLTPAAPQDAGVANVLKGR